MLLLLPSSEDDQCISKSTLYTLTTRNIYTLGGTLGDSTPLSHVFMPSADANCWGITECTYLLWNANYTQCCCLLLVPWWRGYASACCEMNVKMEEMINTVSTFHLHFYHLHACRTFLSSSAFILQCMQDTSSLSAWILQCLQEISFLFRLHSTVPARHLFPLLPSFYSARWTFLSFSAFILQCPQDISFLCPLYSARRTFLSLPALFYCTVPARKQKHSIVIQAKWYMFFS